MSVTETSNIDSTDTRRLVIATTAIFATGWLGDFLFWRSTPGLSAALFAGVLGLGLLAAGQRTITGAAALVLLLTSCAQSAVELCFTNVACLLLLLIIVAGESAFPNLTNSWARWSETLVSWMSGPLRWLNFLGAWAETRLAMSGREHLRGPMLGRVFGAALPAAIVMVVFAALLGAGNAVLAEAFSRLGSRLQAWLFDLSFARTALWLLWLTLGLSLFWSRTPPSEPRWWTRAIPRWSRRDLSLAAWQSGLLLLGVNALFFAANTADALYLWRDARLPAGVNASRFLHEGVYALIAAVVLAAGLLAGLFQQEEKVARSRVLRALALVWVAQNLVLIAGVLRRLQLYIDAYQFSELRIYVGCFLLLVTAGFALLACHVWRGLNLGRLLLQNAGATLLLFFVLQFCDVGTWVAQQNVVRWQTDVRRGIDLAYLVSLGPRGWPALDAVARDARQTAVSGQAEVALREIAMQQQEFAPSRDWRAAQTRRDRRAAWLIRAYRPQP